MTETLQKRSATLAYCRYVIKLLLECVSEGKEKLNSKMYECCHGTKYTNKNSSIVTDPHFESDVVKIQGNKLNYY